MAKAKQTVTEKELKSKEIYKLMYCSESTGISRLTKAAKEGIIKRSRQGYYYDTPELREWLKQWSGEK